MGIFALSTLKRTRRCSFPVSSEKDMRQENLRAVDDIVDLVNGVTSNFIAKEPIENFSRYGKEEQKCANELKELTGPPSIETYNQYMGGINKTDMMLSLYKKKCRTRKWYHHIFIHLLHLARLVIHK